MTLWTICNSKVPPHAGRMRSKRPPPYHKDLEGGEITHMQDARILKRQERLNTVDLKKTVISKGERKHCLGGRREE